MTAKLLQTKLKPVGFNFVSNLGSVAYQVIMHYHVHIIPKYTRDHGYLLSRNSDGNHPVEEVFTKIKSI